MCIISYYICNRNSSSSLGIKKGTYIVLKTASDIPVELDLRRYTLCLWTKMVVFKLGTTCNSQGQWQVQKQKILHYGQFKGRKQFHRAVYWDIKLKRKSCICFRIMAATVNEAYMGFYQYLQPLDATIWTADTLT